MREEIQRLLIPGGTIFLVGGEAALSSNIENDLLGSGFRVHRLGGANRIATSITVTSSFAKETPTILSNGEDFPSSLIAAYTASRKNYAHILYMVGDPPYRTVRFQIYGIKSLKATNFYTPKGPLRDDYN